MVDIADRAQLTGIAWPLPCPCSSLATLCSRGHPRTAPPSPRPGWKPTPSPRLPPHRNPHPSGEMSHSRRRGGACWRGGVQCLPGAAAVPGGGGGGGGHGGSHGGQPAGCTRGSGPGRPAAAGGARLQGVPGVCAGVGGGGAGGTLSVWGLLQEGSLRWLCLDPSSLAQLRFGAIAPSWRTCSA